MVKTYDGSLTREQFLFREMRVTARLVRDGLDEPSIVQQVIGQNLFQYPTEKMIKNKVKVCLRRLNRIRGSEYLTKMLAEGSFLEAKQAALAAMMLDSALLFEFMTHVIAAKYQSGDMTLERKDLNLFFMRLQEQDDSVASWTEQTVSRIKQVIIQCLRETGYISDIKSGILLPVFIPDEFSLALKDIGARALLPVFNSLE